MSKRNKADEPAEGGDQTPPPSDGSPRKGDIATKAGATEAPPEPDDQE